MIKRLYRGKIKGGAWVLGYLYIENPKKPFITYFDDEGNYIESVVDPETIGQDSGLQDKNQKKIFEGDILKTEEKGSYTFIVNFGEHPLFHSGGAKDYGYYVSGADSFTKKCFKGGLRSDILYWLNEGYVVAGNVTDNPELLEVGD